MTRSLTEKRERQKQVQPAYERVARSNDSLDALATLGRLSDDCSRFKRKSTPLCHNTDIEIGIAQLDCTVLYFKPTTTGTVVCGSLEWFAPNI